MTWLELSFLLAPLIIVVLSGLLAILDGELGAMTLALGLGLWFISALMTAGVQDNLAKPVITAQYKIENAHTVMTDNGLSVTTPDGTQAFFKEVKDVEKWRKGGEFYMTYYFTKRNLGFDTEEAAIIIK